MYQDACDVIIPPMRRSDIFTQSITMIITRDDHLAAGEAVSPDSRRSIKIIDSINSRVTHNYESPKTGRATILLNPCIIHRATCAPCIYEAYVVPLYHMLALHLLVHRGRWQ